MTSTMMIYKARYLLIKITYMPKATDQVKSYILPIETERVHLA